MSNYEQIGALYDKAEKLSDIRYSVFDAGLDEKDWIDAVGMRFESAVVTVYVESDFDTLCLELSEMKVASDCYVKSCHIVRTLGKGNKWLISLDVAA